MSDLEKSPLIGLDPAGLRDVAVQVGLKPFAAKQMAAWLYGRRVTDIAAMTDLSKTAREKLAERFTIGREAPLAEARSSDGTVKYLFRGAQDRDVEAVMIPDKDRRTLCVSSQAGCKMRCEFCMTGRQGFHGNLSAAQIVNQILSVPESEDLTNVVFMGMGEPTDNLDAVMRVIDILTAPWGLGWSPKRITVSTVGANLHSIRRLLDGTKVHIALSLHLPFADERAGLMPAERACPSARVLDLLREYDFAHQRRLSVEYIMWDGSTTTGATPAPWPGCCAGPMPASTSSPSMKSPERVCDRVRARRWSNSATISTTWASQPPSVPHADKTSTPPAACWPARRMI